MGYSPEDAVKRPRTEQAAAKTNNKAAYKTRTGAAHSVQTVRRKPPKPGLQNKTQVQSGVLRTDSRAMMTMRQLPVRAVALVAALHLSSSGVIKAASNRDHVSGENRK